MFSLSLRNETKAPATPDSITQVEAMIQPLSPTIKHERVHHRGEKGKRQSQRGVERSKTRYERAKRSTHRITFQLYTGYHLPHAPTTTERFLRQRHSQDKSIHQDDTFATANTHWTINSALRSRTYASTSPKPQREQHQQPANAIHTINQHRHTSIVTQSWAT